MSQNFEILRGVFFGLFAVCLRLILTPQSAILLSNDDPKSVLAPLFVHPDNSKPYLCNILQPNLHHLRRIFKHNVFLKTRLVTQICRIQTILNEKRFKILINPRRDPNFFKIIKCLLLVMRNLNKGIEWCNLLFASMCFFFCEQRLSLPNSTRVLFNGLLITAAKIGHG